MCNCKSYNLEIGTVDEEILSPPFQDRTVCIDSCIKDLVLMVWSAGIITRGSCCGHNNSNPSLILDGITTDEQLEIVKVIIKDNDTREFDILMWKLKLVKV